MQCLNVRFRLEGGCSVEAGVEQIQQRLVQAPSPRRGALHLLPRLVSPISSLLAFSTPLRTLWTRVLDS